jgi:hypothetical protein
MKDNSSHTTSIRTLEFILALTATTICLIVSVYVWSVLRAQQPIWPLPGLYLLEMPAVSILGLWSIGSNETRLSTLRGFLTWVTVGILFAFVVLGALSVGFLFAPVAILFAIAAILSDHKQGHNLVAHLGIGLVATLAQAALMLVVIRLL